ncbi:MAG: serine hydrolase [Parcubacteria group bacterium]|jgi:beta-lactamase class A
MKNKKENKIIQFFKSKNIKKEHFLWLVIFVLLALSSICFFSRKYDERKSILKLKEKYSLISPARSLYSKDDLIINVQPLRDSLTEIGEDPNVSIYFEFLNTGANIAVNKDMTIWPASLMKIPIAMAVMKKIEIGEWNMDSEMILYQEDKDERFGDLYRKPNNTKFTVQELLYEMLDKSDNTARAILMRNLDKGDIEEVLNHLGIEDIYDAENKVTGKKYSIFWRSLYTSSFLVEEYSQQLIEIMSHSQTNEYLSRGLPKGLIFSHKIGVIYEDNIYADSGIVYVPERPYIITVMMQGKSQDESEKIIKEISQKIYNYVSSY